MKKKFIKNGFLATKVFNTPLLMEPGKMRVIANYLENRFGMSGAKKLDFGDMVDVINETDDGDELPCMTYQNVSVISIIGTLVHRGSAMDAESGLMSYDMLRGCLVDAANDPMIQAIILDIDSGGGEVEGNFELARLIRQINDEYKPVIAIANGAAFSGAYSLGSAAGKFYVTETGGVGSVGVIMTHIDYSANNVMNGIKVTNITAGDNKDMFSPDFPLSTDAQAILQKDVDRTYDMFVNLVAEMRNITPEAVKSTQAGLLFGDDAVIIGFVDGISSLDSLLEGMISLDLTSTNPLDNMMRIEQMALFNKNKKVETEQPAKLAEDKLEEAVEEAEAEEEIEQENAPSETEEPSDLLEKAAAISELCQKAGLSHMASGFIRSNASLEDVKAKLDTGTQIKNLCKLAGKSNKAEEFIKSGKSVIEIQEQLVKEMADSQKPSDISNKPDPKKESQAFEEMGKNVIMQAAEKLAGQKK